MNTDALIPLAQEWPADTIGRADGSLSGAIDTVSDMLSNPNYSGLESTLTINADHQSAIKQFAQDNGFIFNNDIAKVVQKGYGVSAAWLSNSYDGLLVHSMAGGFKDYGIRMSIFYKGSGSSTKAGNNAKIHFWRLGVVRIKLNKIFPQLVLDSNKNDGSLMSSLHTSFKQNQRVRLEGDFNQHFDFYAPTGLGISALTVLAPNFMRTIMDSSTSFDVEFFGDEMILTTTDPLYTVEVMKTLEKALAEQLDYIARLEQSWNYTPRLQPFDPLKKDFIPVRMLKVGNMRIPVMKVFIIGFVVLWVAIVVLSFVVPLIQSASNCTTTSSSTATSSSFSFNCN